jgi:hypothetical protein
MNYWFSKLKLPGTYGKKGEVHVFTHYEEAAN